MKSLIPGIAVAVGLTLLVGSVLWSVLFPASRGWTTEKGARMTELSAKAHSLGFELVAAEQQTHRRGRSYSEVKAEADQTSAELKVLRDELNGKVAAPNRASSILRWSGCAFVIVGAFVMMATRGS